MDFNFLDIDLNFLLENNLIANTYENNSQNNEKNLNNYNNINFENILIESDKENENENQTEISIKPEPLSPISTFLQLEEDNNQQSMTNLKIEDLSQINENNNNNIITIEDNLFPNGSSSTSNSNTASSTKRKRITTKSKSMTEEEKKEKRMAANRESARVSRERKKNLKVTLENKVQEFGKKLETEQKQLEALTVENVILKNELLSIQKLIEGNVFLQKIWNQQHAPQVPQYNENPTNFSSFLMFLMNARMTMPPEQPLPMTVVH